MDQHSATASAAAIHPHAPGCPFSRSFKAMLAALRRWHHNRRTVTALSELDDAQLRDIGLVRSEIAGEAGGAAPGRGGAAVIWGPSALDRAVPLVVRLRAF